MHHRMLVVGYMYTLSGPPTNEHLLLSGTIFGHMKLISCSWSAVHAGQGCVTCVNCTFPAVQVGGGAAHTFSIDGRVV